MFTVVLSSADAIHEALVLKSTDFAGRVMLPTTRILSMDGQDLVFSDYNASWKMQRKLAHAALFNQKKLRGNSPAMLREISKLVDGMTAESQQCPSSTVCVRPLLRLTSMNIIARLVRWGVGVQFHNACIQMGGVVADSPTHLGTHLAR